MSYQKTSAIAYDSILEHLGPKQKVVLWAFRSQGDMSHQDLAKFLSVERCCITGRCDELVAKGLLKEKGRKMSESNRPVILWGCTEKGMA